MFARQIAVMKGQAWNVVETLKTPDHGPLELTRRTRVCVWDDLVDIPVAIPLARASAEMRRRATESGLRQSEEEEEMDISAANGSVAPNHDLLGLSPPSGDLPNPNRFELSRHKSYSDNVFGSPDRSATLNGLALSPMSTRQIDDDMTNPVARPGAPRSRTRLSFEGHRKRGSVGTHRRRQSFTGRGLNTRFTYDGDDLEGDLGYAAAEGMEGNQRKVIMERLEAVNSRNPVFDCC